MAFFLVGSAAVFEAPAVVAGLDDVAVVSDAIEQGRGHLGIAEHGRPFAEGEVGRDDHRGPLVELADQVEQQLAAGAGERQVAELLEARCFARFKTSAVEKSTYSPRLAC